MRRCTKTSIGRYVFQLIRWYCPVRLFSLHPI